MEPVAAAACSRGMRADRLHRRAARWRCDAPHAPLRLPAARTHNARLAVLGPACDLLRVRRGRGRGRRRAEPAPHPLSRRVRRAGARSRRCGGRRRRSAAQHGATRSCASETSNAQRRGDVLGAARRVPRRRNHRQPAHPIHQLERCGCSPAGSLPGGVSHGPVQAPYAPPARARLSSALAPIAPTRAAQSWRRPGRRIFIRDARWRSGRRRCPLRGGGGLGACGARLATRAQLWTGCGCPPCSGSGGGAGQRTLACKACEAVRAHYSA